MTKIMLVEDDKSLREIYGVRLLAEGYDIKSAGDGEEALAMAVKEHPDLILSDVMMPKISGFDMLDILRATPETREIKVIMMTALSSEDQRMRGESLGADRYLVKSQVGIEDVVRAVHDVLGDTPAQQKVQAPAFSMPPSISPQMSPNMARPTVPTAIPRPVQVTPAPTSNLAPIQPTMTARAPQQSFTRPVQQIPRPQMQAPAQPQSQPQPAQSFQPRPQQLPQPTAPFSTPAPASLGNNFTNPKPVNTFTPNIAQAPRPAVHTPAIPPMSNFAPNPVVSTVPAPAQQAPAAPHQVVNPTPTPEPVESSSFEPSERERTNTANPTPTYKPKTGNIVINPIPSDLNPNLSDLINQELKNFNQSQSAPAQDSPTPPNPNQFQQ